MNEHSDIKDNALNLKTIYVIIQAGWTISQLTKAATHSPLNWETLQGNRVQEDI